MYCMRLVAGEATWREDRTNAMDLLGVDVATVSQRLPTSNRTSGRQQQELKPHAAGTTGPIRYRRPGPRAITSGDLAYQPE
jgi:hypothetical protein